MNKAKPKSKTSTQEARIVVFRSTKHIQAQLVDLRSGRTLLTVTDRGVKGGNKTTRAQEVGKIVAEHAQKLHLERVVFDRSGFRYHGRVKALAEGIREGGLKF
jgi:large subunit ribosomal protein L18